MSESLSPQELRFYYENEAKEVPIFGSLREISLAENILQEFPSSFDSIIDIGCGDGYLLHCIEKKYPLQKKYGFDLTTGRLQTTAKKVPSCQLIQGNVLTLPFKENSFDVVICSQLLEHIEDIHAMVEQLLKIAKKQIIITVPYELQLVPLTCPSCHKKHYLDGHLHVFNKEKLLLLFQNKNVKGKKVKKFHTIYTYNKKTMRLPLFVRLLIDSGISALEKHISFFKPNFILIKIEK